MKKIKITSMSDLHGNLFSMKNFPNSDIVMIAGDIGPWSRGSTVYSQAHWFNHDFSEWVEKIPAKEVIFVAGNHDFVFEKNRELVSKTIKAHYLCDASIDLFGLKIHGSPWQPPFCDWAFNMPEEGLEEKWKLIPDNTNILLTHGPAEQVCDFTCCGGGHHIGSGTLLKRLYELKDLKLFCFGHCHYSQGTSEIIRPKNPILCCNVSLLDESYKMKGKPTIIEIEMEDGKILSTKKIEKEDKNEQNRNT